MANEKRLISVDEWDSFFAEHIYNRCFRNEYEQGYTDALDRVDDWMDDHPTVDAVPVDELKLHHIHIDQNGIPEVKLQFGERTMILRNEGNPVDVVEVVHGRWEKQDWKGVSIKGFMACSNCNVMIPTADNNRYCLHKLNYCPNCGAKMDFE